MVQCDTATAENAPDAMIMNPKKRFYSYDVSYEIINHTGVCANSVYVPALRRCIIVIVVYCELCVTGNSPNSKETATLPR
jgi:hypothetical protein